MTSLLVHRKKPIGVLINELGSKDGLVRERARNELVKMGSPALDFLTELVESPESILRWEATKAIGQIADPNSVSLLLFAMEDDDYEVRWLATEGLIKIGAPAFVPLLEKLIEKFESYKIREGAHHILREWKITKIENIPHAVNRMLAAFEGPAAEVDIPVVAYNILIESIKKNN